MDNKTVDEIVAWENLQVAIGEYLRASYVGHNLPYGADVKEWSKNEKIAVSGMVMHIRGEIYKELEQQVKYSSPEYVNKYLAQGDKD